MTQEELAELADVSLRTMRRIEAGGGAYDRTHEAIQRALERRGVIFIEENGGGVGVRLKRKRR